MIFRRFIAVLALCAIVGIPAVPAASVFDELCEQPQGCCCKGGVESTGPLGRSSECPCELDRADPVAPMPSDDLRLADSAPQVVLVDAASAMQSSMPIYRTIRSDVELDVSAPPLFLLHGSLLR